MADDSKDELDTDPLTIVTNDCGEHHKGNGDCSPATKSETHGADSPSPNSLPQSDSTPSIPRNQESVEESGGAATGDGDSDCDKMDYTIFTHDRLMQPTHDTKVEPEEQCPVCGDRVSGYHYGLMTCESCKGFFKRTVQNKKAYQCIENQECNIDKSQRKRCPYCRFNKCLRVGMKLEAVRADRMRGGRNKFGPMYKRDRAIKQQQKALRAQMMHAAAAVAIRGGGGGRDEHSIGGHVSSSSPLASLSNHSFISHTQQMHFVPLPPQPTQQHQQQSIPCPPPQAHFSPESEYSQAPPPFSAGGHKLHDMASNPRVPSSSYQQQPSSNLLSAAAAAAAGLISEQQNGGGGGGQQQMRHMQNASLLNCLPSPSAAAALYMQHLVPTSTSPPHPSANQGKVGGHDPTAGGGAHIGAHDKTGFHIKCEPQEYCNPPQQHLGNHFDDMSPIGQHHQQQQQVAPTDLSSPPKLLLELASSEPTIESIRARVLPVLHAPHMSDNGDGGGLFNVFIRGLEQLLFCFVDWARCSCFFKELQVEDQMKLLQNSWSNLVLLDHIYRQVSTNQDNENMMSLITGHCFDLRLLHAHCNILSQAATKLQILVARFKKCSLDYYEFIALKFLVLLNPDVGGLSDKLLVERSQQQVNSSLMDYCLNCWRGQPDRFQLLIVQLKQLTALSHLCEEYLFMKQSAGEVPLNSLVTEMLLASRRRSPHFINNNLPPTHSNPPASADPYPLAAGGQPPITQTTPTHHTPQTN